MNWAWEDQVLSVIAMVEIVALSYHTSIKEERELNIKKWGDEYRRYMGEVPRWNFIKGLWNLRKNKPEREIKKVKHEKIERKKLGKTRCPSCGKIFSYEKRLEGPATVKCPFCGKEGVIE